MLEQKWALRPINNEKMDKVNLPYFYELGSRLHPLTEMSVTAENRGELLLASFRAMNSTKLLQQSVKTLNFCKDSLHQFEEASKEVNNWFTSIISSKEEPNAPDYETDRKFNALVESAKKLETILSEELGSLAVYTLSQKGIYKSSALVEDAIRALPESTIQRLNKSTIKEINEAGKCLVFDVSTAAGFHMMRAVEEVIHQYYLVVCKPKSKKKLESWAAYTSVLEKFEKNETEDSKKREQTKKVNALVMQIKNQDRNLIMHPETTLTDEDALKLFDLAKSVINAMAELLPKKRV